MDKLRFKNNASIIAKELIILAAIKELNEFESLNEIFINYDLEDDSFVVTCDEGQSLSVGLQMLLNKLKSFIFDGDLTLFICRYSITINDPELQTKYNQLHHYIIPQENGNF